MDTPFLIIMLFVFHVVGGVHDSCLDEERSALWEFKQGLNIRSYGGTTASYHKTDSWKVEGDCCSGWDGVECDPLTGHVIGLDLSSENTSHGYINGSLSGDSPLFRLFHLQKLHLSYNMLQGQIPSSIFHLSNLSSLDLTYNFGLKLYRPSLKDLVHSLTKLEHLHLDGVNTTGSTLPDSLSNYSCLISLSLSFCELSGKLPSSIFHLPKLRILHLAGNPSLGGQFPEIDGNSSLAEFTIRLCNFSGRLTSLGRLSNLTYLDLSYNDFLGLKSSSFSWLSNLTKLTHLSLAKMKVINGEIPSQIARLTALNFLDLSCNDLRGQMAQAWLSNLTQLVTLDLSHNRLTGSIPPSLTNLVNLQDVDLSYNRLEGAIPNCFSHLSNLESLVLYSNNLNGTLELDMFHKLESLSVLELSQNNLTLLVSEGIDSVVLDKYMVLGLGSCNLNKFPIFLLNQSSLKGLDLSRNNIHGMVPTWIWNHTLGMDYLNISHNFLTTIEDHPILLPWSVLHTLDISFNMLQGSLPVPSLSTRFYLASNNRWSGHLSPLFCNLSHLRVLDVSNNNISGTIPQCLGTYRTSLSILDLRNNKLHGTMPQSWRRGSSLKMIDLSQNQLQGEIPRTLGNCKELEFIDFGNNKIVGTFPSWLGDLPQLKVLMLQSNRFRGQILNLEDNPQFAQLRIIDISFNSFSGELPSMFFQSWKFMESLDVDETMEYMETLLIEGFYYFYEETSYYAYSMKINNKGTERIYSKILKIFKVLDFSHNQFEGEIPASIARLKGLHSLNLGYNNFSGTIPFWLGDLHQLESLDLSHNKLSGEIPEEFSRLSFLSFFNVSDNNLSGIIPQGGHMDTFGSGSYEGNPGLLAYHPTQPPKLTPKTGEEEEEEEEEEPVFDKIEWVVILMGCGSGLIVGVVLGNELVVRKPLWFVKLLGRWL